MKKLITLGEKVDLLEIAYNLNSGAFVMQEVSELIEYKRFLDQPLTEEMFKGDKAIFVGWIKRTFASTDYWVKDDMLVFIARGHITFSRKEWEGSYKEIYTLHDLAELTKSDPLTLK